MGVNKENPIHIACEHAFFEQSKHNHMRLYPAHSLALQG